MSGLKTNEKRIGTATYRVHQLPFGEARPLLWLGASVITPALEALGGLDLGALLAGGGKSLVDVELDLGMAGKAFRIFFERATQADFERVEDIFARRTWVRLDGSQKFLELAQVRETHWPGRYPEFMQWLAFSVSVHFGPFSRDVASPGDVPAPPSEP